MNHTHPAASADPKAMCHGMHSAQAERKGDSNECVINNYDFEEMSIDPGTYGGYGGSEWPHCDHDTQHHTSCPHYTNMNSGITEASNFNRNSTCTCFQTSKNVPNQICQEKKPKPPCQQTLLQQAMEYLYSLVFSHRSQCDRCNPKPICPRCQALHSNGQQPCPAGKPQKAQKSWLGSKFKKSQPCPSDTPPCPDPTPPCPDDTSSSDDTPTCPNPKCPNAPPTCPNGKPKCPNVTPTCPNPKCPNASSTCPNPKCPNAPPTCPNATPKCPNAPPTCPNPKCPNATPTCPNETPKRVSAPPKCPKPPPCSSTKPPCQNCPAAKSDDDDLDSKDSYCCKESLFEMAKSYLQKIMNSHQNACPHCKQQQQQLACCYAKELLTYLREIIEQAWIYTKKYYEQVCQQELEPAPTNTSCSCNGQNGSAKAKKPPCPPPPCPPPVRCPVCFPEPEEDDDEADRGFTPCCLHNSKGVQPHHKSESHNKSCCLSRKFQSLSEPYDADIEPELSVCSLDKDSSQNLHDRNVMGLLSSNHRRPCKTCCKHCTDEIEDKDECQKENKNENKCEKKCVNGNGSKNGNGCGNENENDSKNGSECENENGNGNTKRKLGLSLSMEPNDHRFCQNPNECKHSKESLNIEEESEKDGCDEEKPPECPTNEQAEQADMPCTGGCEKCNTPKAIPTKCERRMPDDEYKKFLDDQLRKIEKRLADKGTLCRSNCNCMTCVVDNNCKSGANRTDEKDEEKYYYF
ncbi:uncharacterized protein LOC118273520 isoform X1 [Spodoptera frugiperda]|uniref:Uncharacterized protein LOC118273520 isoform X1 n=1 Tax=Spodoptera frugiperda TaxID=7108 RepID=A0A9R0DB12_SPOFR|nr:uncharacterized protein LOC118273520 isoform X1 [Spodoptera frugiperda]XP_035446425.2 uncharacterized protein LOC118273520 isoform X1 [Spodoptera frugiperda]